MKPYKKKTATIFLIFLFIMLAVGVSRISGYILHYIYPLKYEEYVFLYAEQNRLDPYLVFAIIKAESGFDPKAVSKRNAKGLMQITDGTAEWGADKLGLDSYKTEDLFKPETNIRIGCWYLGWLYAEFHDIELVIAAYNSGNGNVSKWLKDRDLSNTGKTLEKIPFKETDNFLKRVKNFWKFYKILYGDRI